MLRVAVCDNDNNICCVISEILQNFFDRQSVKVSISRHLNGITLLNEHCRQKYDIMFLDIDMPEMSGFEIASELRKEKSNCLIIFITSHSELVYDSLDFQPFNFIRKNCSISLEESHIISESSGRFSVISGLYFSSISLKLNSSPFLLISISTTASQLAEHTASSLLFVFLMLRGYTLQVSGIIFSPHSFCTMHNPSSPSIRHCPLQSGTM